MKQNNITFISIVLLLTSCSQPGQRMGEEEIEGALSQLTAGKADVVAGEYADRGGRIILGGDAASDLYDRFEESGLFYSFSTGGYDYFAGNYTICGREADTTACALDATRLPGDSQYSFTIHGTRYTSAAGEIHAALASAAGLAPNTRRNTESHRYECGVASGYVWCGLRAATRIKVHLDNVAPFTNAKTGSFSIPEGATGAGPLAPGQAYEFTFTAGPRHRLAFATMFGQSNDWFFAPEAAGIALYDTAGAPISGDITSQIQLWDSGTEVDEEPAVGQHTGPRQSTSPDGPGATDPNPLVRLVASDTVLTDGTVFHRPAVADMIRVTIASDASTRTFTVRIENVADDASTLQTSQGPKPVRVSPGVWALGGGNDLLFTANANDRGEGLEAIAESGNTTDLAANLATKSGVATGLSPLVWVLHRSSRPIFQSGRSDRGLGLEAIAETGNIAPLSDAFAAALPEGASSFGMVNTPLGGSNPGPIVPGAGYEFEVLAVAGDRLSFATMYGASNDWFFAPDDQGLPLYRGDSPRVGDLTSEIYLWDAGTELSEEPGVGAHIGGPEGAPDSSTRVRKVSRRTYSTPVSEHLSLSLSL